MKKLLALLMLLPVLAFGQDITNRWFTYSPIYYLPGLPDPFTIEAMTDDTADTSGMCIGGGGDIPATRGGSVCAYGNENAQHGNLLISAGSDVGGGAIKFSTGALVHLTIPDSITAAANLVFGLSTDSTPGLTIRSAKADGADDAVLDLTAGGAWGTTRGAGIEMLGDDYGGAAAGGGITYEAGTGTTATHKFNTAGTLKWSIDASGNFVSDITNGGNIQLTKPSSNIIFGDAVDQIEAYLISGNSVDSKDKTTIGLCAGSANLTSRGGCVNVFGNEYTGNVGAIELNIGSVANAILRITTGSTYRWSVPYNATAEVADLVFGKSGYTAEVATIRGAQGDGSDDATLQLTGGGSSTLSGGRGAYIKLQGEDVGGANKGGNIDIVGGVGNAGTAGNFPTITIRNDTADGSDYGVVKLAAGGAVDLGTRGAYLSLYGNENGTTGATLDSGGAANNSLILENDSDGGDIRFYVGAGGNATIRWSIKGAADTTTDDLIFGRSTVASSVATIRGARADASDDGTLNITAGGAVGTTRGAFITLKGDDVGGAGAGGGIVIDTGTGTTQTLVIKTANTAAMTINTDGTVDFNTTDVGWRIATGANTACTTTCGANKGCLFGQDTGTNQIVACSDATADRCLCSTT